MGVDYSANFGIGYKVNVTTNNDETPLGYLECLIMPGLKFFETGQERYGGKAGQFYIVLAEPFKNGLDLSEPKKLIDKFIEDDPNLEKASTFGMVGGILVW